MTDITVRPLPTAFDPDDGPVTIATPSCCCSSCCCCCCLATTTLAVTAASGAAHQASYDHERSSLFPTLLSLLAVPAAIGAIALVASSISSITLILIAGGVAYAAVTALALWAAGATGEGLTRVAGLGVMFAILFAILFFVEIVLAIVTAFIIELLAIAALFVGWRMGRWWGAQAIVAPPTIRPTWPPE